jgi:hypothetical protein
MRRNRCYFELLLAKFEFVAFAMQRMREQREKILGDCAI